MARGNQLTPRGEILTAINISKNSLDIGKSQTINKEGLINEETLTRFCHGQNDCTQEDQNQSAKVNMHKTRSLQIPVVSGPQTAAVALMGASTQRPEVL